MAACYHAGANSYVMKPLAWDALTEVVGQIGRYWLGVNRLAAG
jgi:hypothetical protein